MCSSYTIKVNKYYFLKAVMLFNYRHAQAKRTFFLALVATTLRGAAHHSDQSDQQKRDSLKPAHTYIYRSQPRISCGAAAQGEPVSPHSWGSYITHNDATLSVGLLWTRDRLVAETSTWQHTALRDPRHWPDSKPQSQQASGRRPNLRVRGQWGRPHSHIIRTILL